MRVAALLVLALLATACSEEASQGSGSKAEATSLEISVWPRGKGGPVRRASLRCPARSTRAAGTCARLARLSRPFEPVPRSVACTQVYGGPQVAEVRGTFKGRRIEARFNRTNGCEIDRWNRHSFLFPVGR